MWLGLKAREQPVDHSVWHKPRAGRDGEQEKEKEDLEEVGEEAGTWFGKVAGMVRALRRLRERPAKERLSGAQTAEDWELKGIQAIPIASCYINGV